MTRYTPTKNVSKRVDSTERFLWRSERIVKAAHALAKARLKINAKGAASNEIWNEIERKETALLRAVEKLAGLKRLTFGTKDSS